ncbi:MAG: hypothetical protein V4598_19550 [Bdellovibrionota bacterium]
MKILASIFLLLSFSSHAACEFRSSVKSVYALSGPVTQMIERAGLLSSPLVKGVSIFYPAPESFKGEKIPGGVFLSPSKLDEMKSGLVFFDESQELRKLFHIKKINAVEMKTRNLAPGEVVTKSIATLLPFVSGCEVKFKSITDNVVALEKSIHELMKAKLKVIFFLGSVGDGKLPELVMANDGLVLWLRKKNLIQTYPSELAYLSWSSSILNGLEKDYLFLGMKEEVTPKVSGNSRRATLIYPGCLIPGVAQLEAWLYFLRHKV